MNSIDNPSKDEKQKPNNVQNGTFPIYLFLNGTYSQYSFNSTVLEYKVYLGRNEHSDFSLARNVNYINYLKITGINNHDGEGAVEIDYRVSTTIINNPVAKEGKSANCYIIAATGEYSFPAYKGAYNDLTDAALCNHETAVELREAKNDNSGNIVLSGLSYDPDQNMISFNIDKIDNGNVVIELKNKDGSTEWSWHLWCSKESTLSQMLPGDLGAWGKLNNHTYPNGSIMMDRNLGASSTSATGLYYKYGSKNPFITDNYYGSGTNGSATWLADDKAVNDPCPPGYRVPDISCWSIETGGKDGSIGAFLYWQSGTTFIYYPYSGYINSNMQIITDITQPYTHTGTYEPVLAVTVAGSGYEYRNLTYTLPIDKDSGALLSSDNRLFVYEDTNDGLLSDITITGGEYRSKIKIFGYEKWGDWTKINTSSYSKPGQLALTAAEEVLADVPEIKKFIEPSMKIDTSNALNGYNVRCEAE